MPLKKLKFNYSFKYNKIIFKIKNYKFRYLNLILIESKFIRINLYDRDWRQEIKYGGKSSKIRKCAITQKRNLCNNTNKFCVITKKIYAITIKFYNRCLSIIMYSLLSSLRI